MPQPQTPNQLPLNIQKIIELATSSCTIAYDSHVNATDNTIGTAVSNAAGICSDDGAAERLDEAKMRLCPRCEELKQLVSFTSGTSSGSAKVMSAHFREQEC